MTCPWTLAAFKICRGRSFQNHVMMGKKDIEWSSKPSDKGFTGLAAADYYRFVTRGSARLAQIPVDCRGKPAGTATRNA